MNNVAVNPEYNSRITPYARIILEDRYMIKGETDPQAAFARAAAAFADDTEHAQRIYEYAAKGWFMFSTPVLANGGTDRGLPISCFGGYVDDSRESICDHYTENAWLSSLGGGIGGYWGHLRSNGQATSRGSKSTGIIPFIKVVDAQMLAFSQGGTRRGSYAAYLDVSHPEIEEFIHIRKPTGGDINRRSLNLHNAVIITDEFMRKITGEDSDPTWQLIDPNSGAVVSIVDARNLWQSIINTRVETGEPYIMFKDTVNAALPQPMRDAGWEVHQSNLCVAPETLVLTRNGYKRIDSLNGKKVEVWNGDNWSKVTVYRTALESKLLRVTFSDGAVLECTPEHKFYIQRTYNKDDVDIVDAKDLQIGDKLEKWALPLSIEEGNLPPLHHAYSQGFYSGDGNTDLPYSWLYASKYCVARRLKGDIGEEHSSCARKTWTHGPMLCKSFVPTGYDRATKLEWLAGLLDADGTVARSNNGDCIQMASVNLNFLREIKLMLSEMGVHSKVTLARVEGEYDLPANDGAGQNKKFKCKEIHRLLIGTSGVKLLLNYGLSCERLEFQDRQDPQRDCLRFVQVVSVEDNDRYDETYCFTEPKRKRGCFNGIVTGQCSEIVLPTDNNRTFVCCLSSLNLEYFQEWKDTTIVEDLIRYLDNVLTYFIDNAPPELAKAVNSAYNSRDLGLGAMGFHSYLQRNSVPFESPLAKAWNRLMFSTIKERAEAESLRLGTERGEAPDMKGTGRRNAHLLAIAPNASSSIICDTSPSIEPIRANMYMQKTLSGSYPIRNKYLEQHLEELGMNTPAVWKSINEHKGSVQHLDIPKDTKKIFKTAPEIDQLWLIEHAADRQPYICQAQSLNLFFVPDEMGSIEASTLHKVHVDAWKKGLKTLYYLRSEAARRVENISVKIERIRTGGATFSPAFEETTCLSCEG